jgi:hypothetical protein
VISASVPGQSVLLDMLKDKQDQLRQFTGTEGYHRWSPLFRRMVLTDGVKFVADNGGTHGAYWLADAIASHQPTAMKNVELRDMQFWNLTVKPDHSAVLTCRADSGRKPAITQRIEYTDFDLPEIDLWVGPVDETTYTILLPSEY